MSTCTACGHDHQRLGVRIEKRALLRTASSGHRLRAFGGAWGFSAKFWDCHRAEFDFVQIGERDTGHIYRTAASTFDAQGVRATLNPLFGPQVVLPLARFNKPEDPPGEIEHEAAQDPAPVQLILTMGAEVQGVRFEKAKKPRPRIYKDRKPWGRAA